MNNVLNVARYHLVDRLTYLIGPWGIVAFVFLVNLLITASQGGPSPSKAVVVIYLYFFALGLMSIGRSLPFGLALGASRRSYYIGTALLAITLAAAYGLALALLQVAERATHGWGVSLHFFQVSFILAGPWYLTWLTSFVGLSLLFFYGMSYGIVFARWARFGLVAFMIGQVAVIRAWILVANWADSRPGVGHFLTNPGAAGVTGMLGALAIVLLLGGFAVMRRLTV
ncbi:MAG: ABC transporter permease [Candidatus Dormiibacterota bacterium]